MGVHVTPAAAAAVCPACLGALQHIDDPVAVDGAVHPPQVLHRAAGKEEGSGPGRCLLPGGLSKPALAAALSCGGHACDVPALGHVYTLGVTFDPGFAVLAAAQAAAVHRDCMAAQDAARGDGARAAAPLHVTSVKEVVLAVFRCSVATATQPAGSTVPPLHCHVAIVHGAASAEALAATGCDPLPTGGKAGQRARQQAAWRDEGASSLWPFITDSTRAGDAAPTEQPLPVPGSHVQQQAEDAFNSTFKQVAAMPGDDLLQLLRHPFALASASTRCHVAVCVMRPLLYVGGYYIKQLRGISQTMWMQPPGGGGGGGAPGQEEEEAGGGMEVGNGSVATDIQAALQPLLRCDAFNFVAAGREDMDVRMLGPSGRPFVLEVDNCRCAPGALTADALGGVCATLGAAGRVGCVALQTLTQEQRRLIREGEADKRKCYKALVWLSRPVDSAVLTALEGHKDIALQQRTPIRVLHRRAPLVRAKMVHSLRFSPLPGAPCFHVLHLDCGAGTYVKEFVHGDFGRTQPSLVDVIHAAEQAGARSRGADQFVGTPLQADCIQLDVVSIDMEWV